MTAAGSARTISTTWSPTSSRCAPRPRSRRKAVTMKTASALPLGLWLIASLSTGAAAQVSPDRLVNASRDPEQWLMYSGSYDGSRFTPLDQINRSNVQRLSLQWVFQTGVRGEHETTPI